MSNSYQGLRYTSQFYFCPNFFVFDSYKDCKHDCAYCFAKASFLSNSSNLKDRGMSIFNLALKSADTKVLEKAIRGDEGRQSQELHRGFASGMPVHWGSLSDPFTPPERHHGVTCYALRALRDANIPVVLSTKNNLLLDGVYFDDFVQNPKNILQVSLISINEKLKLIEPGASSITERFELIEKVSKAGNRVVVRMQPFIPEFCEVYLDEYMANIAGAGAKAVTVEFYKMGAFTLKNSVMLEGLNTVSEVVGYDLIKKYKADGIHTGSDIELTAREKVPIMERVIAAAKKHGLEFYSADNDLRIMGDGPICCGYPENFFGQENQPYFNRIPFMLRTMGELRFKQLYGSVSPESPLNVLSPNYINVQSKYEYYKDKTFLDLIKICWNDLESPTNPARFFQGVAVKYESGKPLRDEDGFIVYKYDGDWKRRLFEQKDLRGWFG